jgi:DNA-binding response OmpR family regulator
MKKILVVEDDTYLANAYRVKLSKSGFDVQLAYDGNEALDKLKTFIPDVILLDLIMPKKDGFATLSEIKASETLKQIPVIVASNLGQKEDVEKATKLGAKDFFIKSDVSLAQIIEKINKMIGP